MENVMKRHCRILASTCIIIMSLSSVSVAQGNEHNGNWNLSHLYENSARWAEVYEKISTDIDALTVFEGNLNKSPQQLQKIIEEISRVKKELSRLQSFAFLKNSEDSRVADNQARLAKAEMLMAKFEAAVAYFEPELIAMGSVQVLDFINKNKGLEKHRFNLMDILRREAHTLDIEGESVLANANDMLWANFLNYDTLIRTAFDWPEITLSTGEKSKANQARSLLNANTSSADRNKINEVYHKELKKFEAIFAQLYITRSKGHIFVAKSRKYESVLDSSNADSNIPSNVFEALISAANENMSSMHRYLNIRKRINNGDSLYYSDFRSAAGAVDKQFSIEDAKKITLAALKPFGKEYQNILNKGFSGQWMHPYPQDGKDTGAFVDSSAYDVHPYVLLNFNSSFDSVSEFAHEWGHAVHTELSKGQNSYENYEPNTYLAELASTTNEVLLQEYFLNQDLTDQQRLNFINEALSVVVNTFFKQTLLAEFEKHIFDALEKGQPLSAEQITGVYYELLKKYYGHEKGLVNVDANDGLDWIKNIQLFYRSFYVYQYSTSIAGATAFAERILYGEDAATDDFIRLLKSGGSRDSYVLLKDNGFDLADKASYRFLFNRMNRLLDDAESILTKMGK